MKFLIKNEVNINVPDYRGHTPIINALLKKYYDIAKYLYNSGANITEDKFPNNYLNLDQKARNICESILEKSKLKKFLKKYFKIFKKMKPILLIYQDYLMNY